MDLAAPRYLDLSCNPLMLFNLYIKLQIFFEKHRIPPYIPRF
jgi:hypothetical protein